MLLLVFSCIATYLAYDQVAARGLAETTNAIPSEVFSEDDVSMLSGAFAPLVGVGGSPFIVLTILSGAGSLLNSGRINPDSIPMANTLMQLPISHSSVFIALLIFTILKFILSMLSASKVFCDATVSKLENLTGTVCAVGGAFTVVLVTTEYASDIAMASMGSGFLGAGAGVGFGAGNSAGIGVGLGAYILTNIVAFLLSTLTYFIYVVIKTMSVALDVLAFVFSPIPGATGLFNIVKHLFLGSFTWVALTYPTVSAVVAVILIIIACIVFRAAKRLELYYRRVYLVPFFNAIFRRGYKVPLLPKKLPRGVASEFINMELCIECFFMNRTTALYKRERCYFIRSEASNYIYKKRLLGKTIKIELFGDVFIEKPFIFRFLRIFSDESLPASRRRVNLVVRREHGQDILELIEKTGLIDYNAILEERRRKKAEERTLVAQRMKNQTSNSLASASKKVKGTFGSLITKKSEKGADLR